MQIPRLSYPFALLCMLLALPLYAETNVSGQYRGGEGSLVTLQLTVAPPPPAAFIVLQRLPAGVELVTASPAPSGRSGQQIKWLFKHPRPGSTTVTMRLSKAVALHRLQGEIRFRHPKSGNMFTKRIE